MQLPLRPPARLLLAVLLAAAASTAMAQRVRIMTFNAELLVAPRERAGLTKYRFDAARERQFERVASLIEAFHPDIVNLCEITSEAGVQKLVGILHEKGLKKYRGYHVDGFDSYTGLDVALITTLPPDEVEGEHIRCLYSRSGDDTWRAPYSFTDFGGVKQERTTTISRNAVYYFTIGTRKVGFLGLHLKSNPSDAYSNGMRTGQAEVAQRIVRREIVARGYEPVILGDLNDYDPDTPDADESRDSATTVLRSLKDFDPDREGPELFNAAQLTPRRSDRYTSLWDRNENGVMDPGDVKTMLDHILLPVGWRKYVKRTFIPHITDLSLSDHHPVIVDLEFPE